MNTLIEFKQPFCHITTKQFASQNSENKPNPLFGQLLSSDQFERSSRGKLKFGTDAPTQPIPIPRLSPELITQRVLQPELLYPQIHPSSFATNVHVPQIPAPIGQWLNEPVKLFERRPNYFSLQFRRPTKAELADFANAQKDWEQEVLDTINNFAHLINTDALTGLHNRTFFNTALEGRVKEANTYPHKPVSVAYLDLNDFKLINEVFNHDTGDRAIREFGRILHAVEERHSDIYACRTGGDEFAIIFKNGTSEAYAQNIFRELDENLKLRKIRSVEENGKPSQLIHLSCSFAFMNHDEPANATVVSRAGDAHLRSVKTLKKSEFRNDFVPLSDAFEEFQSADISTDEGLLQERRSRDKILGILKAERQNLSNFMLPNDG